MNRFVCVRGCVFRREREKCFFLVIEFRFIARKEVFVKMEISFLILVSRRF